MRKKIYMNKKNTLSFFAHTYLLTCDYFLVTKIITPFLTTKIAQIFCARQLVSGHHQTFFHARSIMLPPFGINFGDRTIKIRLSLSSEKKINFSKRPCTGDSHGWQHEWIFYTGAIIVLFFETKKKRYLLCFIIDHMDNMITCAHFNCGNVSRLSPQKIYLTVFSSFFFLSTARHKKNDHNN